MFAKVSSLLSFCCTCSKFLLVLRLIRTLPDEIKIMLLKYIARPRVLKVFYFVDEFSHLVRVHDKIGNKCTACFSSEFIQPTNRKLMSYTMYKEPTLYSISCNKCVGCIHQFVTVFPTCIHGKENFCCGFRTHCEHMCWSCTNQDVVLKSLAMDTCYACGWIDCDHFK
jgi:hypothetical protein